MIKESCDGEVVCRCITNDGEMIPLYMHQLWEIGVTAGGVPYKRLLQNTHKTASGETAVLHPSGSVTIETDDDLTTAELVIEAVTVKTPDTFLIDIRGRVNYFRQEFNLTYAEAIGCLEIVKAELLEEVMHDEEEA